MKLISKISLVLSAMSMMLMTSCEEVVEKVDDLKDITATVNVAEVELSAENQATDVLELTWNDASVYVDAVSYEVVLSDKATADHVEKVANAVSPWKYSGADLLALVNEWGVAEGGEVVVKVSVNAVRGEEVVNSSAASEVKVTVKTPVKPLALTVEPLTVNLDEESAEENAVTFTWTDENEHTAKYRLALAAGSKTAVVEDLAVKTYSFNHADFNALLRETLELEAGVTANVEAVVEAYAADVVLAVSPKVSFDVKPFGRMTEYSALAVVGTATAAGTDYAKALEMTKGEGAVFTWKGELKKDGSVRILVEPDGTENVDCIVPSTEDKEIVSGALESLVLDKKTDDPRSEFSWKVATWGIYEITVDLTERTVLFNLVTRKYSNIGMVGPATPNGWDAVNPTLFTTEDYTVFTWEGNLGTGTMRFLNDPSSAGWEVDQYIAASKDLEVVDGEVMKIVLAALGTPRGDNMWMVTVPGTYKITINIDEMTVLFELTGSAIMAFENIKMVGPASPNGWSAGGMTPLEKTDNGWKWTGNLNNGELKFVCNQNGEDWGQKQILAKVEGQGVSVAEGLSFGSNLGGDDWKWNIRNSGEYVVEIDAYGKVKFTINSLDIHQESYPSLGLIGNAAPNGWDQSYANSTLLPTEETGIYTWTGSLKADGLHIMCDVTKTDWSSPRLTAPYGGIVAESGKALPMVWKQNDTSWNIPEEGEYTVTVNLIDMTVTFTKK